MPLERLFLMRTFLCCCKQVQLKPLIDIACNEPKVEYHFQETFCGHISKEIFDVNPLFILNAVY